jgi:hypothetical protein
MRNAIWTVFTPIGILGLLLCGCDLPDRHDLGIFRKPADWEVSDAAPTGNQAIVKRLSLGGNSDSSVASDDDWHFWYLHLVDSTRVVGGVEMQSERVSEPSDSSDQSRPKVKVTLRERVLMQSDLSETTLVTPASDWKPNLSRYLTANEQTFWHAADGRLIRADCRVRFGPLETLKSVQVSPDQVRIESDYMTRQTNKQFPHQGPLAGPLAVYQSLLADPLPPQQQREVTVLLPIQESLANLRIQSNVQALANRMSKQGLVVDTLHEAVALVTIDKTQQRQRFYWYDDDGVVQATNITGEKRYTYLCDQEQYESLGASFISHAYPISVDVPGKPIGTGRLKQLALTVELSPHWVALQAKTLKSNAVAEGLSPRLQSAPRQYVQNVDVGHQRVITSREIVSKQKLAGKFEFLPATSTTADLAATPIVDYHAASVRKLLAVSGAMNSMDNTEKATELNRTVHSLLTFQPLSVGVRPASSIAETSLADSTEHATLLIAMLRARGIPARLAVGLRYLPSENETQTIVSTTKLSSTTPVHRFVYHTWTIAKPGDAWIAVDATTGQPTGPECVMLYSDDLSKLDASQFVNRFLAVLRSIRLRVSAAVMQPSEP